MVDVTAQIDALIAKAVKADKSEDAIRFSQAACNGANAVCAGKTARTIEPPAKPYKGHGVITWDAVPTADLYIVTVQNQATKHHMTYQTHGSGVCVFKFAITDPTHWYRIKVQALGFDGKTRSVPN